MTSAPPPTPAPLTLDLKQYADAVNNAFYNQQVCVIATSNGDEPDVALKGSFMVWDEDHLAYWERGLNETLAAIRANPHVAHLEQRFASLGVARNARHAGAASGRELDSEVSYTARGASDQNRAAEEGAAQAQRAQRSQASDRQGRGF